MDIYTSELQRSGVLKLDNGEPTLGIVAEGVIEIRIKDKTPRRIVAGGSFSLPTATAQATIVNASSEVPAKVITFRLRQVGAAICSVKQRLFGAAVSFVMRPARTNGH